MHRPKKPPPGPYAFETYYRICSKDLARRVRADGGALYVFLTGMRYARIRAFPSAHDRSDEELAVVLQELLDMDVDGFMTDYPHKVMRILRALKVRE